MFYRDVNFAVLAQEGHLGRVIAVQLSGNLVFEGGLGTVPPFEDVKTAWRFHDEQIARTVRFDDDPDLTRTCGVCRQDEQHKREDIFFHDIRSGD